MKVLEWLKGKLLWRMTQRITALEAERDKWKDSAEFWRARANIWRQHALGKYAQEGRMLIAVEDEEDGKERKN